MTDPAARFRGLIERRLGLQLMPRFDGLGPVLVRRSAALGMTEDEYLEGLERAPLSGELGALAEELTVCETYVYRNAAQLRALVEVALPALAAGPRRGQAIRILSAGCASGDEPYSIAIAAAEVADRLTATVAIRAVDANRAMLARAREGRFRTWALRETPLEIQHRYFQAAGPDQILSRAVRGAVTFEHRNLASDDQELWAPASYDVVFCRNVIMYFSPEAQRATIDRIAGSLAPGGYLFLGYAETLRGTSHALALCHSHGAFYYHSGGSPATAGPHAAEPPAVVAPPGADAGTDWVDAIRHAAERIAALSAPGAGAAGGKAGPGDALDDDRDEVLALVQRERFDEALALMARRPPVAASQPDRVLLYAVLLAHRGQLAAAQDACRQLLVFERQVAGAHHVLALCCEAAGDRSAADAHRHTAAYLDPTFAMPHLHLGLAARRTGDHAAARRELGQALALLYGESASRLLLFGGGFDRDALIALCRAELAACGGAP